MRFLSNNKSEKNPRPSERVVIEKDVIVSLWLTDDRLNWALSRYSAKNPEGYRTFKPEHLRETVQALVVLGNVFSNAPTVPQHVQSYCQALAEELEGVLANLGPIEDVKKNGDTSSLFLTQSQ